jgi:hypothetical protein
VVAGFAEALAVVAGGGAVLVQGGDVVVVADGCVAVGGAAGVVPDLKEAAEPGGKSRALESMARSSPLCGAV